MFRGKNFVRSLVSLLTIASLNLAGLVAPARASGDLVPSDDINGGASVFVFRESRKKPQARGGGGPASAGGGSANYRSRRERINSQIAASR